MLARTTVTIVCIEVVVPAMIGHQIFCIDRSAEPFESIVIGIGYLQMVYLRTVSYRAESDSVNLLVLLEPPCVVRGPPSICMMFSLFRA